MSIVNTTSSQSRAGGVSSTFNLNVCAPPRPSFNFAQRKQLRKLRGVARTAFEYPIGIWAGLDLAIGAASLVIAHAVSPAYKMERSHTYSIGMAVVIFSLLVVTFSYALGFYDKRNFVSVGRIVRFGALANLLALSLMTIAYSWLPFIQLGRTVLLVTFGLSTFGLVTSRLAARALARRAKIRVLFVGRPQNFLPLSTEIQAQFGDYYDNPGYVNLKDEPRNRRGTVLAAALASHQPDDIVIEDEEDILAELFLQSSTILYAGITIRSHRTYFEQLLECLPVEVLDNRSILGNDFVLDDSRGGTFKRLLDVLVACMGFSLGLPLFFLAALLVKITSPGPIIYSQLRVGLYGRPFRIYKFRTMCINAEAAGAVWAAVKDKRVTAAGSFLRKTRLDELPQFWNILRGDMSLVGPRPERPEFVNQLRNEIRHYDLRHVVLPGLTGWAQIRYRYGASHEDARRKLAYDLYYVQHQSAAFDLAICTRTFLAIAKGAR